MRRRRTRRVAGSFELGFLSCLIKSGIRLVFGVSAEICSREILLYKGFLSSLFGTELAPSVK